SRTQAIACAKDFDLLDSNESPSSRLPSRTNLPDQTLLFLGRNPFFLGREEVLAHLRRQLQGEQPATSSRAQAICGLGGVGKTQVALEYAYRYVQDYQAVFWTRADSRDTLVAGFLEIASVVRLPERSEQDQRVVIAAVKSWLSRNTDWLLILDNADDLTLLPEFLPSSISGHLLFTTRAQAPGRLANRVEIETLDPDNASLLLLRRAGLLTLDASLDQAEPADWQIALQLAHELGYLPLALDQAGAYLEETRCGLQQYLELYRSRRANLLQRRGEMVLDHPDSVATTWSLSFALIEQRNASAADLLRLCAVLHPEAIPEPLFLQAATHLGPALRTVEANPLAFNQALAVIQNYSLLRRNGREQTLSIHRLVQAVLVDAMTRQEHEQWVGRAIAALNALFPEVSHQLWEQWEQCGGLLPHVLTVAASTGPQTNNVELASLLTRTADYLCQRAQYEQSEPLYQRALSIYEQELGSSHPQVALPLYGLAGLYREQGDYQQGRVFYQRALDLWEQDTTCEHPEIADLLNDLAILHIEQGDYQQSEELLQRALSLDEQMFGPEHHKTAVRLNNLAGLYIAQGNSQQAEETLLRALQLNEQMFGPEHPDVAFPLTNLADLYCKQSRDGEAEPLYQRALKIREQVLGSSHPQVAFPLTGLATLYREQGRYTEAEQLYQRALDIRYQQRGDQHPETAGSLLDFARLYELQKQPDQALKLYQQALHILEQRLGPEHPDTVRARVCCAHFLRVCGRFEEAAALETASG
ncbi:MAG TPA: FxSxx-COOH system tetratricopeptide repeat protein, partial [Ktedonobacteraceae bacterium]|nr:FxSxx-COOH system tetratricopeptide repeat protein [Ktedonobacteraceae bacterium]